MKDEAGFTLMETLCVIALIIICAGATGKLVYSVRRTTEGIRERSAQQFQQLRIEGLIREALEKVAVPYWEQDERGFSMAREAVEKALAEAGYNAGLEFELLRNDRGQLRGIHCRCLIDKQEYEGYGLFASVPLVGEE